MISARRKTTETTTPTNQSPRGKWKCSIARAWGLSSGASTLKLTSGAASLELAHSRALNVDGLAPETEGDDDPSGSVSEWPPDAEEAGRCDRSNTKKMSQDEPAKTKPSKAGGEKAQRSTRQSKDLEFLARFGKAMIGAVPKH